MHLLKHLPVVLLVGTLCLRGGEIRKFEKETIEKLGVAIYEQDARAAQATDLLFARKIDPVKSKLRGWVVEGDTKAMLVRFVREGEGDMEAFYDVSFKSGSAPTIEEPKDRKLSPAQNAQFKARNIAAKSITRPASQAYNIVILPDPERDALLVYALAATTQSDSIMVGGHYRFTISADGERLVQSDELFRSFMVLSKKPKDLPPGAIPQYLLMTTVVSDMPLETHIYLSLLHRTAFMVGTPDQRVWLVQEGKMKIVK